MRLTFKRRLVAFVEANAEKILEAQLDLALGVYEQKEDAMGNVKIYKRRPDGFALGAMVDQVIGRAPQKVEFDGEIETKSSPMSQEHIDLIAQGVAMALPDYAEQNKKDIDAAGSH